MWIYNSWSNKWVYLSKSATSAIELYNVLMQLDNNDAA